MRKTYLLALILTLATASCEPTPEPVVPIHGRWPPTPPERAPEVCGRACERLAELGCELRSPRGRTCHQICLAYASTPSGLSADCMELVHNCDEVRSCGR